MKTFVGGDTVEVYSTFLVGNTKTNPTAVTAEVADGNGDQTTYTYGVDAELTRPSTGIYKLELLLDPPGEWTIRFTGTGTAAGAQETNILALGSVLL